MPILENRLPHTKFLLISLLQCMETGLSCTQIRQKMFITRRKMPSEDSKAANCWEHVRMEEVKPTQRPKRKLNLPENNNRSSLNFRSMRVVNACGRGSTSAISIPIVVENKRRSSTPTPQNRKHV